MYSINTTERTVKQKETERNRGKWSIFLIGWNRKVNSNILYIYYFTISTRIFLRPKVSKDKYILDIFTYKT